MCWPQPRSTTASTLTLLSGTGPTTRCDSGSPGMPFDFLALLLSSPTSVTRIDPSMGLAAGGTSVAITGTNLADATAVYFGSTQGTIISNSATQIVVTSPVTNLLDGGLTSVPVDVVVTTALG